MNRSTNAARSFFGTGTLIMGADTSMGQTNFVLPAFAPRFSNAQGKCAFVWNPSQNFGLGRTFGSDLTRSVIIFGGLFITAAAVCSTLEMSRPSDALMDNVRVDDYAVGPAGFDPYALDCRKEGSAGLQLTSVRECRTHGKPAHASIIH